MEEFISSLEHQNSGLSYAVQLKNASSAINQLKDSKVSFIKIDVEGMELEVLEGLKNTIAKYRPNMYIEVQTRNIDAFLEYLETNDYKIVEQTDREIFTNYMVVPK